MAQKSVPNLRAAKASDSPATAESTSGRARSANEATESDPGADTVAPKLHRSFSRKLSRVMLPKRSASEDCVTTQNRPTSERPNTPKHRSISLDRLKTKRANRDTPAPEVPPVPPVDTPIPPRPSTRQENMKDQILQYFKTDQVANAWETEAAEKKEKKITRRASLKLKEGPLSAFRKRSSNALRTSERPQSAVPFERDLDRQMAWLQEETAALDTYSLKPKREVSPRLHVLDVQSELTEEVEEEGRLTDYGAGETGTTKGDAESLITALPSFPLPPVRVPPFVVSYVIIDANYEQITEVRTASPT